jgi:hypothetical protein
MFTDELATPTRLETLLDLFRSDASRRWNADAVGPLLQPETLADVKADRPQTKKVGQAARELGLLRDNGSLAPEVRDSPLPTRALVLAALDERVLGGLDVEPYFAPFYAFLLGLGKAAGEPRSAADWVAAFRTVYPPAAQANPFNQVKLTGLHRWYAYAGLGWYDPRGVFHCNPCERLARRMPAIFGGDAELPVGEFIRRLADHCPELDGGTVFQAVNPQYDPERRRCSLGLSHALVELHLDGLLQLRCPADSDGWHINEAEPPHDPEFIRSERIASVTRSAVREVA